jgi:hypothetical protein
MVAYLAQGVSVHALDPGADWINLNAGNPIEEANLLERVATRQNLRCVQRLELRARGKIPR